jgi:CheY-like chemotaxis protein
MVPAEQPRKRLLLVEDDDLLRETLTTILEAEGYAVLTAADGEEALRRLHAGERPDLILLDLMMPGMDGWQFRREQARDRELASVPVVVFSAVDTADQKGTTPGVAGHLEKPVETRKLLETIRRHCPPGPR